jgi:hypothetical protein
MEIVGVQKENGNEKVIFEFQGFCTLNMICRILSGTPQATTKDWSLSPGFLIVQPRRCSSSDFVIRAPNKIHRELKQCL